MNIVVNILFVVTHLVLIVLGAYKFIFNKPNDFIEIFSYYLFEGVIVFYFVY